MNEKQYEKEMAELDRKRKANRQMIASMVVAMGYEPESWAETRAIAEELVAGKRGRRGKGDSN